MNFTFLPVLAYNISRMRSAREYSRAPKNLLSFCFWRKSSRLTHHQTSQQYGHTLWLQLRICAFYYGPLSNVFVIFILFIKPLHIFHIHRKPVYRMHQTSKNQRRGPSLQFVEGIFPKNKINMEICHYPISDFSFGPNMLGLLGFYRPYIHKHAQNMKTRKC